ncbi:MULTISPECIES: PilZ domain-containing protein [unclassified Nitratiruptor]|uniref:PilZ domain-containing protein n=1 Tax=unclassified Nitratiruptor TaxID=2624044 RepID=UPI001915FC7A|nr:MULTISPECIES: PilZ domain-containing protein [unclassified Nitratiruptor]BCD60598.1 hypothetical protein NitYY0810_C1373 [Nitratiruptor sp. YY08-10]BCD64529.1 hypothetical protein NitYY0814_C1380 [Nitratiruptor sp. YY08-14]
MSLYPTNINTIHNSKNIPISTKAKFYLDSHHFIPVQLCKKNEHHNFWKILYHKENHAIGINTFGRIIIHLSPLSATAISATIKNIYKLGKDKIIKIPHTSTIEYLSQRSYPRVEVDISALLERTDRVLKTLYCVTIVDISYKGIKIFLDDSILDANYPILLRFKLDNSSIEFTGKIVSQEKFEDGCFYSVVITKIDPYGQFLIDKFIQTYMHKEIKSNK